MWTIQFPSRILYDTKQIALDQFFLDSLDFQNCWQEKLPGVPGGRRLSCLRENEC